jgi:hypothetical protein
MERRQRVNKAQWTLVATLAASLYDVGTIWMTQFGWRLWPYVAPGDFGAYHEAWWAMIKPVIFPVGAVAFFGSIALIWWRPEGVTAAPVWLNVVLQVATYALTAAFWGRWQAHTHYAKLPDGSLDPMYLRGMSTHWIRAAIITANGLLALWMMIEHLSSRSRPS